MTFFPAKLSYRCSGYCLGFCHDTFYANGTVAWLAEIMVSSSHRRQSIGESLMASLEEWEKLKGAVISALATRRAANFYLAIEYQEPRTSHLLQEYFITTGLIPSQTSGRFHPRFSRRYSWE